MPACLLHAPFIHRPFACWPACHSLCGRCHLIRTPGSAHARPASCPPLCPLALPPRSAVPLVRPSLNTRCHSVRLSSRPPYPHVRRPSCQLASPPVCPPVSVRNFACLPGCLLCGPFTHPPFACWPGCHSVWARCHLIRTPVLRRCIGLLALHPLPRPPVRPPHLVRQMPFDMDGFVSPVP